MIGGLLRDRDGASMDIDSPVSLEEMANNDRERDPVERMSSVLQYHHEAFALGKSTLAQQFASIYFCRLVLVRDRIFTACNSNIDERKVKLCLTLLELEGDIDCIIVGTIYKNMKLKPSILDEYRANDANLREVIVNKTSLNGCFVSDDDHVELEDEHARLTLTGDIDVKKMITGLVMGVRGRILPNGHFYVKDFITPNHNQIPRPIIDDDKFVLLVSGLNCGDSSILPHLMVDHITGMVGGESTLELLRRVSRVIICGNSVQERPVQTDAEILAARTKRIGSLVASHALPSLSTLDMLLKRLCASVDVDLMPGRADPCNISMPQQAFNGLFLPRASTFSSLHRITNPANISIDGVSLLGTSGENVLDILNYTLDLSALDVLEETIRWCVSCPTCPDTLHCFPYGTRDPFTIIETPHVYFAGNQSKFDTRMFSSPTGCNVRLISVPAFSQSGEAVILNLRTLDCDVIQYSSQ